MRTQLSPQPISGGLLALFLALSLVLLAARPCAALPPEKETWHRVETESFVVYSNAGEKRAAAVGRDLERFNLALDALGGAKLRPSGRTLVLHLWGKAVFRPCLPRPGGQVREIAGLFQSDPAGNVILLDAASEWGGRTLVHHELVHERLRLVLPDLPSWLHEGLAQYHETFVVRGDEAEFGHPIPHAIERLRSEPLLPLAELLGTRNLLRDAWDEHPRFYAEAWLLTHYLRLQRPGGGAGLEAYARAVASGADPVDSAWTALATTEAGLTAELNAYAAAPSLRYARVKLDPALLETKVAAASVVPRAEALVALGQLLALVDDGERFAESAEHFAAALALDPSNAAAASGLARCAELGGRMDEALALHERALALAPRDPRLLHAAGRCRMARELRSGVGSGASPESRARILAARALLASCVALDPRNADAQALLGLTYFLHDGPVEPGIAALEAAHALLPSRTDVASNLEALRTPVGHVDVRRAPPAQGGEQGDSSDSEQRYQQRKSELIAEAAGQRALQVATEHVREGRHAEALAVLLAVDLASLEGTVTGADVAQVRGELARYLAGRPAGS